MTSRIIEYIDLENLALDLENPRLPVSFRNEQRDTKSIINWLLRDASIIELMTAIGENGFFVGEALLVTKVKADDIYTVVEGNRRLASLLLLSNPKLAKIHNKKIQHVLDETSHRPTEIPCIIFEDRKDILIYLGYRHITGIKTWSLVSKARYLSQLKVQYDGSISEQSKELAKQIGSRSDYVKKLLVSYLIYEEIEENGFYNIPELDDTNFYFNYISDSLSKENIRKFIGANVQGDDPLKNFSSSNLKELIFWFFKKNEKGKSLVLGNSTDLKKLNSILSNAEALEYFRNTGDLSVAENYVNQSPDTYSEEISKASRVLKFANSFIHKVPRHNVTDIELLKEINGICKTMRDVIIGKEDKKDDWD